MFGHQRLATTGIMLGRSSQTAEVSMAQSGLADEKERSMPLEMLFIFLGMWLRFSRATSIGRGVRAWSRLAPGTDDGTKQRAAGAAGHHVQGSFRTSGDATGRPCLRRCAWRDTSWPWWARRNANAAEFPSFPVKSLHTFTMIFCGKSARWFSENT